VFWATLAAIGASFLVSSAVLAALGPFQFAPVMGLLSAAAWYDPLIVLLALSTAAGAAVGSAVAFIRGAALVVYGAWLLSTSGVTSSTRRHGAIAGATLAVIVVYLLNGLLQGPFSPLHSTVPMQTGAPVRSAPPTR